MSLVLMKGLRFFVRLSLLMYFFAAYSFVVGGSGGVVYGWFVRVFGGSCLILNNSLIYASSLNGGDCGLIFWFLELSLFYFFALFFFMTLVNVYRMLSRKDRASGVDGGVIVYNFLYADMGYSIVPFWRFKKSGSETNIWPVSSLESDSVRLLLKGRLWMLSTWTSLFFDVLLVAVLVFISLPISSESLLTRLELVVVVYFSLSFILGKLYERLLMLVGYFL